MKIENPSRIARKEPTPMNDLLRLWLKSMNLESSLNLQRIFAAWDKVTGAGGYTLNHFFKNGVLYCTISSSVVRSQLYFQRQAIRDALNAELEQDEMFTKDDPKVGYVKTIVLK